MRLFTCPVFADANAGYDDSEFVIFGVPFDGTSCFRPGARSAPAAMRAASYNFETYSSEHDVDLCEVPFCDLGDIEVSTNIDETLALVRSAVEKIIGDDKVPIMMGGEHTLTHPCIQAFDDVGVMVLDAHLDQRDEYSGSKQSHACVSRRILEECGVENYVSIGIRSGAREEYDFARQNRVRFYTAEQVQSEGIDMVLQETLDYLGTDRIYLSIDIDAIDPAYAPAAGTPEPFGITPSDVRFVIKSIASRAVGFDMVEIAPAYDHGQTALLGAKLIREFIVAKKRGE